MVDDIPKVQGRSSSLVAVNTFRPERGEPGVELIANSDDVISHVAHIVAVESHVRAATAKMIFAGGHHAEVYADAKELLKHHPRSGIVLAHESETCGAASVCDELSGHGLWLPVIGFGLEVDATRIVAGMRAGAMDYLVGTMSPETLMVKFKQCAEEAIAQSQFRSRQAAARSMVVRLSQREREVLDRLVMGMSNKEMARDLEISPRTVEIHRMKMMGKLGAKSVAQAVCMRLDSMA